MRKKPKKFEYWTSKYIKKRDVQTVKIDNLSGVIDEHECDTI